MNLPPSQKDWDLIKLAVIQAMLGEISSNFRMISVSRGDGHWILNVVLACDREDDMNSIEEILENYSVCIEDFRKEISESAYKKLLSCVFISKNEIKFTPETVKNVLYLRKE